MQENNREEDLMEIDLLEIFGLLLSRLWIIVLTMVVFGAIAFGISAFVITPKYQSTTGIYIMTKSDDSTISYTDTQLSNQLIKDYVELITTRAVLENVITECGLPDSYEGLKSRITISNATNTHIIYITVKDESPSMAQYIANTVRERASEHITNVTDVEAVNIVDKANLPTHPSEPSISKWTIIGIALGAVLSAAVIIIVYLADDTIKTSEDVEKYLGLSTLGLIPLFDDAEVKGGSPRKKTKRKTAEQE